MCVSVSVSDSVSDSHTPAQKAELLHWICLMWEKGCCLFFFYCDTAREEKKIPAYFPVNIHDGLLVGGGGGEREAEGGGRGRSLNRMKKEDEECGSCDKPTFTGDFFFFVAARLPACRIKKKID